MKIKKEKKKKPKKEVKRKVSIIRKDILGIFLEIYLGKMKNSTAFIDSMFTCLINRLEKK